MRATKWIAAVGGVVLAAVVGGSAGGCGGGSNTQTANVLASEDGYWTITGAFVPTIFSNSAFGIAVGDSAFDDWVVGYVRFDLNAFLASLPPGATITAARLTVAKFAFSGLPFTTLGADHNIHVDHALFSTPSVVAADWNTLAPGGLDAALLTGGVDAPGTQYWSVDVLAALLNDLTAMRTTSDFKFRFATATNSDSTADFAAFNDMEMHLAPANVPLLSIDYHD
jgi:hypothetical protein